MFPGRLCYDTMQNPEFRPRMACQSGALQTLTTGVSSIWSTTYNRFIRAGLRKFSGMIYDRTIGSLGNEYDL